MPYSLLPHIIFLLALAGLIVLIAKRMPEALEEQDGNPAVGSPGAEAEAGAHHRVLGNPAPRVVTAAKFWLGRTWQFVLEAKGMKTPVAVRYRLQRWFGAVPKKGAVRVSEGSAAPEHAEQYYLGRIEEKPKDISRYDSLAVFYLNAKRFAEARDVYDYLTKRKANNPLYYSRLAYAHFKLGQFTEAVENYKKSLALDSAQPNRYYNLGLSLDAAGKFEEAVEAFKKAIDLEPHVAKYADAFEAAKNKLAQPEQGNNART